VGTMVWRATWCRRVVGAQSTSSCARRSGLSLTRPPGPS
jgi:hypothetical protein